MAMSAISELGNMIMVMQRLFFQLRELVLILPTLCRGAMKISQTYAKNNNMMSSDGMHGSGT